MNLVEAAKSGDKKATLVALRDHLAAEIEASNSPRDTAALSARLTDVLDRLEALPETEGLTNAEKVAERRRKRQEAAESDD